MKTKILIPLAGLALFCACKGKAGYELAGGSSADSSSAQMDSTRSSTSKLIKTAEMRFKVKNVQKVSEGIAKLVTTYRGMLIRHRMASSSEHSLDIRISNDSVMRVTSFYTSADITVKIPAEKLNDFMNQVAGMGIYVNNRSMDVTDKSLEYLSAQLKLKSRSELISRQKKGIVIIKNPANVLLLKDDMIDQQINNRGIDDAVKNSIVNLRFYESNTITKETIANDDPSAYNLPLLNRIIIAIENGWRIFVDLLVLLFNLWVFVAAGVSVWLIIRRYKFRLKPTGR